MQLLSECGRDARTGDGFARRGRFQRWFWSRGSGLALANLLWPNARLRRKGRSRSNGVAASPLVVSDGSETTRVDGGREMVGRSFHNDRRAPTYTPRRDENYSNRGLASW